MKTYSGNIGTLLAVISQIKTPSFVSVNNYLSAKDELANHTINLGISYGNAKDSDIAFLSDAKNIQTIDFGDLAPYAENARLEMLQSKVSETNPYSIGQSEAYITVCPNVRVHIESGRIYIYGLVIKKHVIKAGIYKQVNSRPLTLAKNLIKNELKTSKFREFAFDKLGTVTAKGTEIEIFL